MATTEKDALQENTQIPVLSVTPSAIDVIVNLMQERELDPTTHALRVFVAGGGCSGMSYGMSVEDNFSEFDTLVNLDKGMRVVIDANSLMYMQGATIDYVDSLMGGGFRIENPMAVSSCGCGSSFRTEEGAQDSTESACGCSSC